LTATICYRIARTRPIGQPEGTLLCWILIRSATVEAEGRAGGLLPDADAAFFTSEAEATLFAGYLKELEKQRCDTAP
jgi:hypothetical protein